MKSPLRPPRILAFAAAFALGTAAAPAEGRPNILFLISDDQAYETVGAFGLTDIETPSIDRLVEGGATFTHAYNMGSWSPAVCLASRAMLNAGVFLWPSQRVSQSLGAAGEPDPGWPNFKDEGLMWSQLMQAGGYRTYFTGKWHVRTAAEGVFDVARNVRGGMPAQTEEGYNRPLPGQPDPWSPYDPAFGGFWEGGRHWTEVTADDAVDFLGEAAGREEPFFMYVSFNAPHDPRQSPKEYVERYPLERIEVPDSFLPVYPYHVEIDNPPSLRDERLAPHPRTEHAVRVNRQEYYAIVTHMDTAIGRVLDALEESGMEGETWVLFTSDHGLAVGHHGLMGKQNMYDHSLRVPLVAVGPGVEAGRRIDAPVYLQDVMPTALDIGGIPIPEHVQFRSLLPVLAGEAEGYEAIYGAYLESQRCVVQDGFKLILYPRVPKARLYDLEKDPLETEDIAASHPDKVKALFAVLRDLQEEAGDTLDLAEFFPRLAAD